ncbi:HlyD family efflux transporter periplasmic adaptor subunit [Metabacillus sp. Hm71]|uniref:HlyD family efflux transporter periplasmic adaptor subunit n=1 Tax=Metabacillus sp. Hm71 TaxID=3450743 RepID=UPI003F4211BB
MKRWKIILLTAVTISFIGLNVFLIGKEDSKVQHTVHVEKWTRVQKDDIVETFETNAVMKPQEEVDVYFHPEDKEFQRFLVKEGDEITTGTPLLEYTTPELDQLRETLEAEKEQTESEIEGIDDYISSLEDYQASIPSSSTGIETMTTFEEDLNFDENENLNEDLNIDENASSDMIISVIQQEIYRQELEKSKLEAVVEKYDSQLSHLNEQSETAVLVSEIDGIVKKVDDKLENPVVTIASHTLTVKGALTEAQFKKAETGMKFTANVAEEKKPLEGTLEKISPYPAKEPEIGQKNYYPFEGQLTEQSETVAIGAQAAVSVVTAEAIGVPTLSDQALHGKKSNLGYRLNENGRITKQTIQTGLGFNGIQEITKGAELGQVMMLQPDRVPQNKASFVTEMKPRRIDKAAFKALSKRERWEAFLIGLVEK